MVSSLAHSFQQIRSFGPSERALVSLIATHREGLAYVVPPTSKRKDIDARSRAISFPHLTSQVVEEWLMRRNDAGQVTGGFQLALDKAGMWLLEKWTHCEASQAQENIHALPLREVVDALPEAVGTLRRALHWIVENWRAEADILSGGGIHQQEVAKRLRGRLALPFGVILTQGILEVELGWFLHEAELEVLLPQLSEVIMVPLRQWLNDLQLDDPAQPITFVPHGRLGRLPLQAALVPDTHTGKKIPFQETCKLTYQKKRPPSFKEGGQGGCW